jgi:SecD/SecF fusion protein
MTRRRRNLIVLVLVFALLGGSAWVISDKKTVEGLDLRGGTELVYQGRPTPQVPTVTEADINRAIEIIRERVDQFGVSEPEINRVGSDQVEVGLPDVQDTQRAIAQIGTTAQLYLYDWDADVIPRDPNVADPNERPYPRLFDAVEAASKQKPITEEQCDAQDCTTDGTYYLFDKSSLQPIGEPSDRKSDLFANLPGEKQPANSEVIKVPRGTVVVEDTQTEAGTTTPGTGSFLVLHDRPALTGNDITNPEQNFDPTTNEPNVTFDFTDEGRTKFQDVTRTIAQRGADDFFTATGQPASTATPAQADQFSGTFAIVLDGEVESRPQINFAENPDGIDGRTGAQISGSFTVQEAQDLAETLKIGALPIKLALISQSTVSATLGQEALDQGIKAGLIGLGLVLLFLLFYYRFLGIVAGLGLLVYAVYFLALIKLIPITLTLPGIAGLILTIGVAADANIVIFERIKEEIRHGRSTMSAISEGYKKGIATIVDANVITLLTAFILFGLATAGVKGFAFTLFIGTVVSLFTAVLFTQAILGLLGRTRFLSSPAFLGAREKRHEWKFDFTGASKWFFSVSGVILTIGAIAFATKGFNFGIDFESGTKIEAALAQPASAEDVRNALTDAGIDGAADATIQESQDPTFGENVIQVEGKIPADQTQRVRPVLENSFGLAENSEGQQSFESTSVGPSFGEEIARKAVLAILFSLLVISAYVAIRFEAKYAVPVLIALVHDILITAGVYALVGQEVSSATVAAFLTILGYSMYDTIIVFDRIRENVPRMPRAAFSQIVNRSMSEVLTRSLITGLSTVFLIGVLLVFGGDTLRDFAFAMMVGVASGTYSSIFIASPVLTEWKEREPAYRSRRARIKEAMGFVPTFPEDNVVAKIDEAERHAAPEPQRPSVGVPAETQEEVGETPAPVAVADPPAQRAEPPAPAPEGDGGPSGRPEPEPKRSKPSGSRKKQSRRRRKHGRAR